MKQALLYVSPFLPQRSGISDYSEILIYGLRHYFDITLLTDDYSPENERLYDDFRIINRAKGQISFDDFPIRLYNIGNNPYLHSYIYEAAVQYPGFIILHEYILYFLTVGYFLNRGNLYSKLYELGGAEAISIVKPCIKSRANLLECKHIAAKLPLNREIIQGARGVLVHSRYTYDKLCAEFPGVRARIIPMVSMGDAVASRGVDYLLTEYGIPSDAFVIASFGFIAETKLNHLVCRAVMAHNEQCARKIYYVLVGEGSMADDYLSPFIIKTGYVGHEVYSAILGRSDLVANFRYPTMGETSISLIHAMSFGKPCMVTDDAWFAELPDSVVVKVSTSDLFLNIRAAITALQDNPKEREKVGMHAQAYVKKEHRLSDIARSIHQFMTAD